jgi:hypothetical protein
MSSLELQFTDSRILEPKILDVLASDCSASTACASSVSSIYSCRTPLAVSSNYIQDCLSILHAKIFLQGNCLIHAWKVLTDWSRAIQLDDLIFRCNDNESTDYYSLDQSVQNTTGLQHPRKSTKPAQGELFVRNDFCAADAFTMKPTFMYVNVLSIQLPETCSSSRLFLQSCKVLNYSYLTQVYASS